MSAAISTESVAETRHVSKVESFDIEASASPFHSVDSNASKTSNLTARKKDKPVNPRDLTQETEEDTLLERTEPQTLLAVMCRNPQVRLFAQICGVHAPDISINMTWYQALSFVWSWLVRIGFVISIACSYVIYDPKQWRPKSRTYSIFTFIFILKFYMFCPILYDICYRKQVYTKFKSTNNTLVDISSLMPESYGILIIFGIIGIIYVAVSLNAHSKVTQYSVLLTITSLIVFEIFVYFAISYELLHVETVIDQELIAAAETGHLTVARYNAIRKYVDEKSSSHRTAFFLYCVVVLMSCIDLLGLVYFFSLFFEHGTYTVYITNIITYEGKDILILFLIIWKIASINEKSRTLTRRVADFEPDRHNTYIYMQQNSKPIVYLIGGLIALYKTDLIVSLCGYVVSFIVTAAKSKGA